MGLHTIRQIYNYNNPVNLAALEQCKEILLAQFPYMNAAEADELLLSAQNPLAMHYRYLLLVAEGRRKNVLGLAIASYFPKEKFYFLDYIATQQHKISGGVGGALYERLREEAASTGSLGIFFECLPDDPDLFLNEEEGKQNIARLRFYERYGARPLAGTEYALRRTDYSVFYLVYDGLGVTQQLKSTEARKVIRAILENKHAKKCSPEYIQQVVSSVKGSHVTLRPSRYATKEDHKTVDRSIPADKKITLVVNEGHLIHHIKERGYVESPVRVKSLLKELGKMDVFETVSAKNFPDTLIEQVHDPQYLKFLKKICAAIGNTHTRYPDIFPVRNATRLPQELDLQIGYYCIDTFTPLNANAYIAARGAVNCALTAAEAVLNGRQLSYALVRPPGHHAERKYFGGFCYLNANAIAAHYLSKQGTVAILDIDYHHGNGQQNIFYHRQDVFTVSIHGNPEFAYPNFTGFEDEYGEEEGVGFNLNIPLKRGIDGKMYRKALARALEAIKKFNPTFLVIALGLDTAKGDPTGTWLLSAADFAENGKMIAALCLPTVIVQEGGYQNRVLGVNARHFFDGLWNGFYQVTEPTGKATTRQ